MELHLFKLVAFTFFALCGVESSGASKVVGSQRLRSSKVNYEHDTGNHASSTVSESHEIWTLKNVSRIVRRRSFARKENPATQKRKVAKALSFYQLVGKMNWAVHCLATDATSPSDTLRKFHRESESSSYNFPDEVKSETMWSEFKADQDECGQGKSLSSVPKMFFQRPTYRQ